jgi:hypothetical protein
MNSTNPSNPLEEVLLLCCAEVLQLNYLTATPQNRSTAALHNFVTLCAMRSAPCAMLFSNRNTAAPLHSPLCYQKAFYWNIAPKDVIKEFK